MRRTALGILLLLAVAGTVLTSADAGAQGASGLVFSEVHYHPESVGSTPEDFDPREDTEFLELLNLGTATASLAGWCVEGGVDFCFGAGASLAPGQTAVLADNSAAFAARYGFTPAGVYEGRLSNSGEQVRLRSGAGAVVASIAWQTANPWPVTPDGGGPSLELVSADGDPSSAANWAASTTTGGTPGSAPALISNAPPLVTSHAAPDLVAAGETISVTAQAVNTNVVNLVYNINWGSDQTVAMTRAGGSWQATLPSLSAGGFIQYRFEAQGAGGVTTSPRADDSVDWWAVGVASPQPHQVPVLDLFFSPQNWTNIDNKTCPCTGAVAYEGRIWTNVAARRAGFTSLNQAKAHFRLDFPAGSPFEAGFLDGPVDELTLDSGFPNYDIVREQLSWQYVADAGFPPVQNEHVRVHQAGAFHGLYLLREEQDGDWRSRNGLDNGAFYKVESWSPATFGFRGLWTKKEALGEPDTDIEALAQCVNRSGDALRSCLLATTDVPQMINEFATVITVWQTDQREFNFFVYRNDEENGLWRMLPDDLDRTWGSHSGGGSLINPDASSAKPYRRCVGTDGTPANEICRAFMNVPEFKEMYLRRIRTLTDELLADPKWRTRIGELRSYLAADWNDDDARWNRTSASFDQIMQALDNFVPSYIAHLRSGGHEGNVPAAQSTAPAVTATGYRSDPGDGLGYVLLTNPSTSESVDLSNWNFDGIAEIPEGVIVLPGATVAISTDDRAFRLAQPQFDGVRAEAEGTLAGRVSLVRRDGSVAAQIGDPASGQLILNEWNAVSSSNTIVGGDAAFGAITGNGGDWFELVVTEDELDVRGWRLVLADADGATHAIRDTFVFADDERLSRLHAGTIVTVSESQPDDLAFNPSLDDWHINLQANSADQGALFTAASQSNFDTNHENWQLTIFDAEGRLVFGPAGEGIGATSGVNSSEVGELEVDPAATVNPSLDFGDGDSSTFGLPNVNSGSVQSFAALRYPYVTLDVDCSGEIELTDAVKIARLSVRALTPVDRCPLANPTSEIYVGAADADRDGVVSLSDAVLVARCSVGVVNPLCP